MAPRTIVTLACLWICVATASSAEAPPIENLRAAVLGDLWLSKGWLAFQITAAVHILSWAFLGGPAPPLPFPRCGPSLDAEDAALGCEAVPACR